MIRHWVRNAAILAAMVACGLTVSTKPALAEVVTLSGGEVARALTRVLQGTVLTLDAAGPRRTDVDGRETYRSAEAGTLVFGPSLQPRRFTLAVGETGLVYRNGPGSYDTLYFNIARYELPIVYAVPLPTGFNLVFAAPRDGPALGIGCRRREGSRRTDCPPSVPALANWGAETRWAPPTFVISLRFSGRGLALDVDSVSLPGRIRPAAAMGCTTASFVPGNACFIIDRFLEKLPDAPAILPSRRPFLDPGRTTLAESIRRVFRDDTLATTLTARLTDALGVRGRVLRAEMRDRTVILTTR